MEKYIEQGKVEERRYSRAEYLRAFADRLVLDGLGTRKKEGCLEVYRFNHENLNSLEFRAGEAWIGLGYITVIYATISGNSAQIKEFMRAARDSLSDLVESKEVTDKQNKEQQ